MRTLDETIEYYSNKAKGIIVDDTGRGMCHNCTYYQRLLSYPDLCHCSHDPCTTLHHMTDTCDRWKLNSEYEYNIEKYRDFAQLVEWLQELKELREFKHNITDYVLKHK